MSRRPEDYIAVVRRAARHQARRMPGIEEDDLYGAAIESLCRAMPTDVGVGNYAGLVYRVACRRMVDAYRVWRHESEGRALAPLCEPLEDWHAPSVASAEDEAMRSLGVSSVLACLSPLQRRVALAAMEWGGQRRLAAEMGMTEGRLSQHRSAARLRLAHLRW